VYRIFPIKHVRWSGNFWFLLLLGSACVTSSWSLNVVTIWYQAQCDQGCTILTFKLLVLLSKADNDCFTASPDACRVPIIWDQPCENLGDNENLLSICDKRLASYWLKTFCQYVTSALHHNCYKSYLLQISRQIVALDMQSGRLQHTCSRCIIGFFCICVTKLPFKLVYINLQCAAMLSTKFWWDREHRCIMWLNITPIIGTASHESTSWGPISDTCFAHAQPSTVLPQIMPIKLGRIWNRTKQDCSLPWFAQYTAQRFDTAHSIILHKHWGKSCHAWNKASFHPVLLGLFWVWLHATRDQEVSGSTWWKCTETGIAWAEAML